MRPCGSACDRHAAQVSASDLSDFWQAFQFYRPSAFAIAQTVVDVPLVFVQVTIFDVVVYFMSNLSRTPSQFFISLLFLFFLVSSFFCNSISTLPNAHHRP